jgi:hypothetical protein
VDGKIGNGHLPACPEKPKTIKEGAYDLKTWQAI